MASTPTSVDVAGEIMARDGLKAAVGGNIVGREGPRRDVKVLLAEAFNAGFPAILETVEAIGIAFKPPEQRRHSILINCN